MNRQAYLTRLNDLENGSWMDWNSPAPHVYQETVGKLTMRLDIEHVGAGTYAITHELGHLVKDGGSEDSATIAMRECVAYAREWVMENVAINVPATV